MKAGQSDDRFLRGALRANAWVAGIVGAVLFLAAGPLAEALGLSAELGFTRALAPIFILGLGLYVFSAVVGLAARRRRTDARVALAALLLNAAWVVGSVGLLLVPLALSPEGVLAVVALAYIAAGFAAVELYGLWRARPTLA